MIRVECQQSVTLSTRIKSKRESLKERFSSNSQLEEIKRILEMDLISNLKKNQGITNPKEDISKIVTEIIDTKAIIKIYYSQKNMENPLQKALKSLKAMSLGQNRYRYRGVYVYLVDSDPSIRLREEKEINLIMARLEKKGFYLY